MDELEFLKVEVAILREKVAQLEAKITNWQTTNQTMPLCQRCAQVREGRIPWGCCTCGAMITDNKVR